MKKCIFIILLIVFLFFISSCGNKTYTIEELNTMIQEKANEYKSNGFEANIRIFNDNELEVDVKVLEKYELVTADFFGYIETKSSAKKYLIVFFTNSNAAKKYEKYLKEIDSKYQIQKNIVIIDDSTPVKVLGNDYFKDFVFYSVEPINYEEYMKVEEQDRAGSFSAFGVTDYYMYQAQNDNYFLNRGTVSVEDNLVILNRMTPGYKVKFVYNVPECSSSKYKIIIRFDPEKSTENIYEGLFLDYDGIKQTGLLEYSTDWIENNNQNKELVFQIGMTLDASNIYQNGTAIYSYLVVTPEDNYEHIHTFSNEWTSDETNHWHASTCSHDVKSNESSHTFGNWNVVREATEELEGLQERTCSVCGYKETQTIEKLEHTHTFSNEWSSNETNHWHASTCSHDVKSNESSHTFGNWNVVREATEELEGLKERVCSVCGYKETSNIDKLDHTHTFSNEWSFDENNHWHTSTCGHEVKSNESSHTFGSWNVVREATEELEGLKERICSVCGYKETSSINKLEHSHIYVNYSFNEYEHWKECNCGEKIEFSSHQYNEGVITLEPTEETKGIKTYTCNMCGFEEEVEIPLNGLEFVLSTDGKSYSVRWIGNCSREVIIPNSYNNLPVLSIEPYAFYECIDLISIEIPSSLLNIGEKAFYGCYSLVEIINKSKLDIVAGSESNGYIGYYSNHVINDISETKVSYEDGFILYSDDEITLVSYNYNTQEITINSKIKSIKSYAFYNCNNMDSVYYDGSIADWLEIDFEYLYSNPMCYATSFYYLDEDGDVEFNDKRYSLLSNLIIPSGTTKIKSYAFYDFDCLTDINVIPSVEKIEDYAFKNCRNLNNAKVSSDGMVITTYLGGEVQSVVFTDLSNLENIGFAVFEGCSSLETISVPFVGGGKNENTYFGYIFGAEKYFNNNLFVPSSLKEVKIFNGCKSVDDYAFYGCNDITKIEFSDTSQLLTIGKFAFYGCSSLETMTLPFVGGDKEENTYLGYIFGASNYFENNNYISDTLKEVKILECCDNIDFGAFYGCSSLETMILPFVGENKEDNTYFGYIFGAKTYLENSTYVPSSLRKVSILKGCKKIDKNAFANCSNLNEIEVPSSVTNIGQSAFNGCNLLKKITLPFVGGSKTDNTFLGYIFGATNYSNNKTYVPSTLKMIVLQGSCEMISKNAFYSCSSLEIIQIPYTVISMEANAFYGCENLKTVYYVGFVDQWVNISFSNFTSNPMHFASMLYIRADDEVVEEENGQQLIRLTPLDEVKMPSSVKSINDYAFHGCTNLKSVSFSKDSQLLSIGCCAFYDCTGLTAINIPSSLTNLGEKSFYNCNSLKNINIPSKITSIGYDTFFNCENLSNVYYDGNVKDWLNISFFSGYSNPLSNYASLYLIHSNGFTEYNGNYYTLLTNLVFDNGIKSICDYAFFRCNSLETIIFSNAVENIGRCAFYGCESITSLEISSSVQSIGEYAFACCNSLERVVVDSENNVYDSRGNCNAIINTASNTLIVGCNNTIIPQDITIIGELAFANCTNLKNIEIPSEVISIGEKSFFNCDSLTNIVIPSNLIEIKYDAFSNCDNLTFITFEDGCQLQNIEDHAFSNCSSLTSIVIPSSVVYIGDYSFGWCTNLRNVIFEKNSKLKTINAKAFNMSYNLNFNVYNNLKYLGSVDNSYFILIGINNYSFKEFNIHKDCKIIADYSFYEGSLTKINFTYDSKLEYIGDNAFAKSSLTRIEIPSSIVSVGNRAFYDCYNLIEVKFSSGSNLKNMGKEVFSKCTTLKSMYVPLISSGFGYYFGADSYTDNAKYIPSSLEEVTILDGCTNIERRAFYDCKYLKKIVIPKSVLTIETQAFFNCISLESITLPFVGYKRYTPNERYQNPFGFIFNTFANTGTICVRQDYYSGTAVTNNYYIPATLKEVIITDSTYIPYGAFSDCRCLTNIVISNNTTIIGDRAFIGCKGITSIEIPSSVTSIGSKAFYACFELKKIIYKGTKSKWSNVTKGSDWNYENATIVFS